MDVSNELTMFRNMVNQHEYPGQKGNSEMLLIEALAEIARKAGTTTFTASYRQIEDASGLSRNNIINSLQRLRNKGVITYKRDANRSKGTHFHLKKMQHGTNKVVKSIHTDKEEEEVVILKNYLIGSKAHMSVWSPKGLGTSSQLLYAVLSVDTPLKVRALAKTLNKHPTTLQRSLKRLLEAGLCTKVGTAYLKVERDLDEVAAELGLPDVSAIRKERHERERRAFNEYREENAGLIVNMIGADPSEWKARRDRALAHRESFRSGLQDLDLECDVMTPRVLDLDCNGVVVLDEVSEPEHVPEYVPQEINFDKIDFAAFEMPISQVALRNRRYS